MELGLPVTLNIGGVDYEIYTDFRSIITILCAYNDPEIPAQTANYVLINNLFVCDISEITDYEEALKQAIWFVDGGKEYKEPENSPKLMDWEQDYDFIISAVDKNLNTAETVLDLEYMHWWTFLRKFSERKETRLDTLIGIREKLIKGEKLDKHEKEILRENRDIIILKDKNNEDFENELWGD